MRLYRNTLLGATFLMGVGSVPAMAQETPAPAENESSNEIVVTATRRAVSLQDVPINISALTGETLSRNRIDDVRGLAAFTPGLTVTDTGPGSTGNIVLRGINSGDTRSGSDANNSIGVYLGEVPLYVDFKFIDINRVEVLQGPQGTLYGLGTLAGAVRYIPNRPDTDKFSMDLHGRGYAQSHSDDFGRAGDVTLNIPIVKDHIAFRTATGYYDNAGFIDYNYLLREPGVSDPQPVRGASAAEGSLGTQADYAANFRRKEDLNYEHTFTTRNQLLLEYNPDLKLYLTYAHQNTKTGGGQVNGAGVLGTGRYESPSRYEEPASRKADLYAAELNINLFDFAQMVSTTAYTTQHINTTEDNTDLLLDLNYGYEAFPQFSSYANNQQRYRQFNEEVRLVSTHGGPLSWVIGGFYNRLRFNSARQEYTPGFSGYFDIGRDDDSEYISFVRQKTTEKAVYGEATFHITPKWQVTGGLRYYKYKVDAAGGSDLPLLNPGRVPSPLNFDDFEANFIPSRVKAGSSNADGLVWKANTSYKVSDELLVYGTYSTGYRVGGVNRVPSCTQSDYDAIAAGKQALCALPDETQFGPDKTRNMEVGVRGSLFDRRLQFTVDGFRVNWSGIQVPSTTINGALGITRNGRKARSQGFDVSAQLKVTPELTIQAVYSYVDAHLTELAPELIVVQDVNGLYPVNRPPAGATFDGEPGDRLPGSTKNSGAIQATYIRPLANDTSIEFSWAATYTGDIYSRVGLRGFGTKIGSYVTHRAAVTYHGGKFDVGMFADNIFDKYAVTSVSNDESSLYRVRDVFGTSPDLGMVERFYGQSVLTPRRVGIEVSYHY
jgi:outer membrane receptor protein involved in Fe transport